MDDFVIVYIKFILIYSKIAKEHAMHLEVLLQKLSNKEEWQEDVMTCSDKGWN